MVGKNGMVKNKATTPNSGVTNTRYAKKMPMIPPEGMAAPAGNPEPLGQLQAALSGI